MTNPQIQQNQIPNEPDLRDLLNLFRKQIMLGFNCHAIATIQSFDSTKQTASATVAYKKTVFNTNALGVYGPQLVDYPVLVDCPVICLGGGGGAITFPIANGDECLVLFNDRDIDNWFQGGGSGSAVATPRLHSFSDGLILVGLRSLSNVLVDYDNDGAALRFQSGVNINKVIVKSDKIVASTGTTMSLEIDQTGKLKITNATAEFVAAIYQLFTDVQGATAGGFPLVMPTFVADLLNLASFK